MRSGVVHNLRTTPINPLTWVDKQGLASHPIKIPKTAVDQRINDVADQSHMSDLGRTRKGAAQCESAAGSSQAWSDFKSITGNNLVAQKGSAVFPSVIWGMVQLQFIELKVRTVQVWDRV